MNKYEILKLFVCGFETTISGLEIRTCLTAAVVNARKDGHRNMIHQS